LHARGCPALNDLEVPVDAEPIGDRVGDDATDTLDARQFIT
jgi:hypothetical protein